MVLLEYKIIISAFLQEAMFKIGLKKFLRLKKLQTLRGEDMLLVVVKVKELLERFTKKNCKKTNQKEFRVEKVIKRKGDKLYVKWKGYNSSFTSWIDKKNIV